jgi:hypothetical protein
MGEVMDRSRRVFGHLDTFENVFPTVEEAVVEFTESDFGVTKRTGRFHMHYEGGLMACGNPCCRRGGYEFDRELGEMIRNYVAEKSIRLSCRGDEGSPKGRKIGRRCTLSVDAIIRIRYRDPALFVGRIPKAGERVGAIGLNGVFKVIAANEDTKTVDIRLASGVGQISSVIPWSTLVFIDGIE